MYIALQPAQFKGKTIKDGFLRGARARRNAAWIFRLEKKEQLTIRDGGSTKTKLADIAKKKAKVANLINMVFGHHGLYGFILPI